MSEALRKALSAVLMGVGVLMVGAGIYLNTQGPNPCGVGELFDYPDMNSAQLVKRYRCAGQREKAVAEVSRTIADQLETEGGYLYAQLERREVLKTFPQPKDLIAVANAHLRTAQHFLRDRNLPMARPLEGESRGEMTPLAYLQGAQFYFNLSLEFAGAVKQPFAAVDEKIINEIVVCIEQLIHNTFPEPLYCPQYL